MRANTKCSSERTGHYLQSARVEGSFLLLESLHATEIISHSAAIFVSVN